jgi:excisionase family DNA binding protein
MWVTDPATTSWPSPEHGEVVEIPLGNGTPGLISIPELAELLGSTPRHVRRLVADRRIPYLKIGGKIRFDPVEIALWLDIQRVGSRDDGDR